MAYNKYDLGIKYKINANSMYDDAILHTAEQFPRPN